MFRNYELDFLKAKEQYAFQRKQEAFQRYAESKNCCNEAYDAMQIAWQERCSAKEKMNQEWAKIQKNSKNNCVWDEYGKIRDKNTYEIERLRAEADSEHRQMVACFERANSCYERGNKSEASYWSSQGHEHKESRNSINEEVSRLCHEVKSARQNAELLAPKTDSSAFHRAKEAFGRAKLKHEFVQAEFKRLKAKRDYLKAEFYSLQEEHMRLKEELQRKVELADRLERDRTLDKAGIRWSEREDAKIVKKADGTTHIYYGGIGKGDGYGHGHTALDQYGNKTYNRDVFEEYGSQNFADTSYDRRARPGHEIKVIEGVKFKPNFFRKEGQE